MKRAIALLILPLAAWPGLAFAEQWVGRIHCTALSGMNDKPLHGDFQMQADGGKLTYTRPVHVTNLAATSGIDETGHGDWTGDTVTLTGGATGPGYSYTATYTGGLKNGQLILSGQQIWQSRHITEPNRDCRINLHRAPP